MYSTLRIREELRKKSFLIILIVAISTIVGILELVTTLRTSLFSFSTNSKLSQEWWNAYREFISIPSNNISTAYLITSSIISLIFIVLVNTFRNAILRGEFRYSQYCAYVVIILLVILISITFAYYVAFTNSMSNLGISIHRIISSPFSISHTIVMILQITALILLIFVYLTFRKLQRLYKPHMKYFRQ